MRNLILEATQSELVAAHDNASEGVRDSFKELLRKCAKDHDFLEQFETHIRARKTLIAIMIGGLIFQMPEIIIGAGGSLGIISLVDRKKLVDIYKCALIERKKQKTIKESKKVIRLTESDISRLVKKVIKEEDESQMSRKSFRDFSDYQYELDHYMENLKSTFNDLWTLGEMVMNDDNLSEEQKDEITWTIEHTLDDLYAAFLDDSEQ